MQAQSTQRSGREKKEEIQNVIVLAVGFISALTHMKEKGMQTLDTR